GRVSIPLEPALNRFGGMGDATCLWGSLARVPSGSGRLAIGPPPRWLTTCPTTQFTLRFPKTVRHLLQNRARAAAATRAMMWQRSYSWRKRSEEHTSELQSLTNLV